MSSTPAGWYPDPLDEGRERLWTGTAWTEETRAVPSPDSPGDSWRSVPPVTGQTPEKISPPPAAAAPLDPPTSLRDLLASRPQTGQPLPDSLRMDPSNDADRSSAPRTRRRHRILVGTIVALVPLLLLGGFLVIRSDQYRRQSEFRAMLELVEESESIMLAWKDEINVADEQLDDACSRSEAECQAFFQDPYFQEMLKNTSREAARSLETIADEFQGSRGLRISSWHGDVILARNSYLDHNAAWVRYLEAAGRNPEEIFVDGVNDDDIAPTWTIACRNFRRVAESSMYPNLSESNQDRVEKICAE